MKENSKKKILISIFLTIFLLLGTFVGNQMYSVYAAQEAVDGLFSEDKEALAKKLTDAEIDNAIEKVSWVNLKEKRQTFEEEIRTAEVMLLAQKSVENIVADNARDLATFKAGINQIQIDEVNDKIKACRDIGKEAYAQEKEKDVSIPIIEFKAMSLLDSLFHDKSGRTMLKEDASIEVFNQAMNLFNEIQDEAIRNQFISQAASIGEQVNAQHLAKEAEKAAAAEAERLALESAAAGEKNPAVESARSTEPLLYPASLGSVDLTGKIPVRVRISYYSAPLGSPGSWFYSNKGGLYQYPLQEGISLAGWTGLPFGTKVEIPGLAGRLNGDGIYEVADYCGAQYDSRDTNWPDKETTIQGMTANRAIGTLDIFVNSYAGMAELGFSGSEYMDAYFTAPQNYHPSDVVGY
ncbi:MAG: toxin Cry1Ac domain D-VI-related protein [Eubacteriaceae bacterium]